MNIRMVHTLRADWLYGVRRTPYICPTDTVRIKTSRVSVLGT